MLRFCSTNFIVCVTRPLCFPKQSVISSKVRKSYTLCMEREFDNYIESAPIEKESKKFTDLIYERK